MTVRRIPAMTETICDRCGDEARTVEGSLIDGPWMKLKCAVAGDNTTATKHLCPGCADSFQSFIQHHPASQPTDTKTDAELYKEAITMPDPTPVIRFRPMMGAVVEDQMPVFDSEENYIGLLMVPK